MAHYDFDDIKSLLSDAHKACYAAHDAMVIMSQALKDVPCSPIGMSHGLFSGIQKISSYISILKDEVKWLRSENRFLKRHPIKAKRIPLRAEKKVIRLRRMY